MFTLSSDKDQRNKTGGLPRGVCSGAGCLPRRVSAMITGVYSPGVSAWGGGSDQGGCLPEGCTPLL